MTTQMGNCDQATSCDSLQQISQLSQQQRNAVELVLQGKADTQVAEALGVHRSTIFRWRHRHPAFCAELNSRRRELCEAARERFKGLLTKAIAAIEDELNLPSSKRHFDAAVFVLRMLGAEHNLHALEESSGPADAASVVAEMMAERARQIMEHRLRDLPEIDRILHQDLNRTVPEDVIQQAQAEILAELQEHFGGDLGDSDEDDTAE